MYVIIFLFLHFVPGLKNKIINKLAHYGDTQPGFSFSCVSRFKKKKRELEKEEEKQKAKGRIGGERRGQQQGQYHENRERKKEGAVRSRRKPRIYYGKKAKKKQKPNN